MSECLNRFITGQGPCIARALQGTVAALAALVAAALLHLENPFWAAMTALIVIQPTRGLLWEKSFYRLVGTVVGAAAGLLLILSTRSPVLLTIALSLWLPLCVGIGNLLYGLRSYAFMMAGVTCSVIAMSGYQDPGHSCDIAFSRIACIMVGVMMTTVVTALFTPNPSAGELSRRLGRVAGEVVGWLALLLCQGESGRLVRQEQDILIEIAEIEGVLDEKTAGHFRGKEQRRQTRILIADLLCLMAVGRLAGEQLARHDGSDRQGTAWRKQLAGYLEQVAKKLASSTVVDCLDEMGDVAQAVRGSFPLLGRTLQELVGTLRCVLTGNGIMVAEAAEQPPRRLLHHRDWQEARRASCRALLVIGSVGVTWSVSGWSKGPLMLIAISIMISIFSTKEHPPGFVGQIFIGAAIGSATAVLCRNYLLSGVADPLISAAISAPFMLIGVFAMQQRRTAIAATDATLFFLFVSQPGVSVAIHPLDLALGAIAMLMGVGSVWLAYRCLVPINPAIRLCSLQAAILLDLERLAAEESSVVTRRLTARLQHRVMRLVAMATRNDSNHRLIVDEGIAALAVCTTVGRLREMRAGTRSPAVAAIVGGALQSLAGLGSRVGDDRRLLAHTAMELAAALGTLENAPAVQRELTELNVCQKQRCLQCPT